MGHINRRDALRLLGKVTVTVGVTTVLAACGGGNSSDSSSSGGGGGGGGDSCSDGITPTMDQHTHPTCLTFDEIDAGVEVTLTMHSGSTGHTHQVTLSDEDLALLQAGTPVTVDSTTNGHTHEVTFTPED